MTQNAPEFSVLPLPLVGDYVELVADAGRIALYRAGPASQSPQTPLLLVHSVNASASAAEVAPLFDHYRRTRPVYALDLPGYGLSDRSDRAYTPRLMTDALHAAVALIREQCGGGPVDVLGVSLACEYVVRLHSEAPNAVRRMALVSPTGFSGSKRRYGPPGSTRGIPWLYKALANPAWSGALFNALTRPGVIRYFLERTWGSTHIDEALYRYDVLTTRQPGAKNAPLYFLAAYLFSGDISSLYEAVDCRVWMSMASRGDFTDYRGRSTVEGRPNWQFHLVEGGALPYFENSDRFLALLDPFWD